MKKRPGVSSLDKGTLPLKQPLRPIRGLTEGLGTGNLADPAGRGKVKKGGTINGGVRNKNQ